ncbi:MAG: flavin reductase [bacterium]|nr:flavin reductase [bacterium]
MEQHPYLSGSILENHVGLLLVEAGPKRNAMTITCFGELAHHPTSLWVSVDQGSLTHELIMEARTFSLAILSARQKQVAVACGTVSGREKDKCGSLGLFHSGSGFLCLKGALASSGCRVTESHEFGDHTLFFGDIVEGSFDSHGTYQRRLMLSDL